MRKTASTLKPYDLRETQENEVPWQPPLVGFPPLRNTEIGQEALSSEKTLCISARQVLKL